MSVLVWKKTQGTGENYLLRWDDVRVPVTGTKTGGAKDPDFAKVRDNGAGSQGVYAYVFDAGQEEELFFAVQMPHSYSPGTDLKPHCHWMPTTAGAGSVVWGLEYTIANVESVFPNTTILRATIAAQGTAYRQQIAPFGIIPGTNLRESTMLICRIFREAANPADTYPADAALLEFDIHFRVVKDGTLIEFPGSPE